MSTKFPPLAKWNWHLPETINIGVACTDRIVELGKGQQLAMIVEDDTLGTSQYSYQQLADASSRFANVLLEHQIEAGDRVLIRLPNSLNYPTAFFGSMKMGAIAVPTSTLLAASEVDYLANDSGAKVLITDKSMWLELEEAISNSDHLHLVLLCGNGDMPESHCSNIKVVDLEVLLETTVAITDFAQTTPQDAAYLVYTSGTTGYPKGVLHGHRSLIGRLPASEFWFDFKEQDRILHSGKFNWTYVLGSALMDPLYQGKTVIVHEGENDANLWPRLIKQHNCTIFIGVPTIYRQIIQKTNFTGEDLPSLRHCMSAGEHLSDEMLEAWRKRFGMDVYEAIGMSEISYYISQNINKPIRPGAAGFSQPGHDVHLLDADLNEVDVNQEGMICIPDSDPGLFLKYWQKPEQTAEARHSGWFFTGDYAKRDAEGYIWFLGRRDDIINTFGYRVSPHEIERVMKTHPAIADCVALGEEIGKDKTLVSLCVIFLDGKTATEDELLKFGSDNLAKYKAPKIIHIMNEFPRTKNGKVIRKTLLKELSKEQL